MAKRTTPVDAHVGTRLRTRRTLLGLSQTALADSLDLTFQQVQKYEKGSNRIGASRLYQIGRVLDVPVAYFFEEMEEGLATAVNPPENAEAPERDTMLRRETLELVRAYYKIEAPTVRRRMRELIKAMATAQE
ncbi:MAG: helix-turn-helix transcriptional regulator [Rhodospirillaceae bacterium]|jgi:transcriptional regulator with XRE-family HTH domain|nr:helix-turn-helix transcriptional regulator [Rhodospirillaceae bacterium]